MNTSVASEIAIRFLGDVVAELVLHDRVLDVAAPFGPERFDRKRIDRERIDRGRVDPVAAGHREEDRRC